MSFRLRAPYPGLKTTTLLPSPTWGDTEKVTPTITSMRSLNGTLYTYVKSRNGKKKYKWDFEMSRNKALELRAFLYAYFADLIEVIDHNGISIVGYFTNNPFELAGSGRAYGWPGNEAMQITLEMEEA